MVGDAQRRVPQKPVLGCENEARSKAHLSPPDSLCPEDSGIAQSPLHPLKAARTWEQEAVSSIPAQGVGDEGGGVGIPGRVDALSVLTRDG